MEGAPGESRKAFRKVIMTLVDQAAHPVFKVQTRGSVPRLTGGASGITARELAWVARVSGGSCGSLVFEGFE